jgi:hypothetical protein
MAGPGSIPHLGDGLRTTMVVGFTTAGMDGAGGRARFGLRIPGVLRWLASLVGVVLESASGWAVSAGWHWRLSKRVIAGGDRAGTGEAGVDMGVSTALGAMAISLAILTLLECTGTRRIAMEH